MPIRLSMAVDSSEASQHSLTPLVWQVASDADLRWRVWDDDEPIVYHPRSGDTHILNPLSAAALQLLQQQQATCSQIVDHVADLFTLKADGQLLQQMEECLSQFHKVGLIESQAGKQLGTPIESQVDSHIKSGSSHVSE